MSRPYLPLTKNPEVEKQSRATLARIRAEIQAAKISILDCGCVSEGQLKGLMDLEYDEQWWSGHIAAMWGDQ
jgi:hypothetical protein